MTEISYRYSDPKKAHIYIAFEVLDGLAEREEICNKIREAGMEALDITDNEMAKTHARFLAGGRSSTVKDEKLYRFTFPERPGALKNFLTDIEDQPPWNIRYVSVLLRARSHI